jgi:microcystin degradation protein MlrC
LFNFFDRLIQRRNGDSVDRARALAFAWAQKPAINSRILVVTRRDQPVFNRPTLELVELPAEYIRVKRLYRFRLIRVISK